MFSYQPSDSNLSALFDGTPTTRKLTLDLDIESELKKEVKVTESELVRELERVATGKIMNILRYSNKLRGESTDTESNLLIIETENHWWSFETSNVDGILIQRSQKLCLLFSNYRRVNLAREPVSPKFDSKIRSKWPSTSFLYPLILSYGTKDPPFVCVKLEDSDDECYPKLDSLTLQKFIMNLKYKKEFVISSPEMESIDYIQSVDRFIRADQVADSFYMRYTYFFRSSISFR